jgi:cytochrome c oxidase assembly factor CtaG
MLGLLNGGGAVTTQDLLWTGAGIALALAVLAAIAEYRRTRRRDLDRVGIIPWNFIQVIAFLCAMLAAALALKA